MRRKFSQCPQVFKILYLINQHGAKFIIVLFIIIEAKLKFKEILLKENIRLSQLIMSIKNLQAVA